MENDPGEGRSKRQKLDKTGRFAALQRFREHKQKGTKNKYEVDTVDNVYDVIDEKEYSKRVLDRQDVDWIVDDGTGYYDDGREIFDDDLDSESIEAASKNKGKNPKKRKAVSGNVGKGNLQFMLSNMPTKKKEEVNLGDDDILSELIEEIDETESAERNKKSSQSKKSVLNEKQEAKNYMSSFSVPKPPKITITPSKPKPVKKETPMKIFKAETILEKPKIEPLKPDQNFTKPKETKEDSDEFDNIDISEIEGLEESELANQTSSIAIQSETSNDFDMTQLDGFEGDFTIEEDQNETITEEQLLEGWTTMTSGFEAALNESVTQSVGNTDELPLKLNEDGKKTFPFFWWDAYEDRRTQPGVVFLFGKTYCETAKKYVSCCVVVRNILRKIFLLPRTNFRSDPNKAVTLLDVYNEFNNNMKLDTFKSKKTTKNYPFDSEIPLQSEYLEIRYSAKSPSVPQEHLSGETYSKIFGINTSYLEILLLEQKIKGPCWIEVSEPEAVFNKISWCKYEVNCLKSTNLKLQTFEKNILPPPPITLATINMRTIVSHNSKGGIKNEIVMISCLVHNKYCVEKSAPNPPFEQHFCVFARPEGQTLPPNVYEHLQNYKATRVQKMDSEKALLTYFVNQFNAIDPDLVVGHDLQGYQTDLLCHRIRQLGMHQFAKLGRLKRGEIPPKGKFEREIFVGRLVCDMKVSARELIRSRSYDLDALCETVLKLKPGSRLNLEPDEIPRMYQTSSDLLKLIGLTMQDTAYILKMMYELNAIPLSLQITNIAGNVMSRTLLGGRSERNEYLLLHAFTEKDYLVPDKEFGKKEPDDGSSSKKRKKPSYSGGLVLDPKIGFYDTLILLMDFNSLYPSIIQEYNVCFTTVLNESEGVMSFGNSNSGILPTEIRKLVDSRREVKKLMKYPDLAKDVYMQYNIRQTALKLTANSMYGCLGFSNSRFYAKNLAAFITQKGREILTNTKDAVEKMSFEVIYGDTDSIMINTKSLDYDQVFKVGSKIKLEINKLYKQVELDIDGVFKYLLLLKKKKYAAVTLSKSKSGALRTSQEHKGLDIVRRDWSQLSSEAGKIVLNHILSEESIEEKIIHIEEHLTKLKTDLESNLVPLPLLVITKQLTKNPKEYSEKNSLTHVQVALRYNSKGGKQLQNGDTVAYVICDDGSNLPATQRGYHIDELKNSTQLKIDVKYYLANQIHPVISRLCEPMPGLDAYQIANWLGLDPSSFKKPKESIDQDSNTIQFTNTMRFKNSEPFVFVCFNCKKSNEITDLFVTNQQTFLSKCSNPDCEVKPADYVSNVRNQLKMAMRGYAERFYAFRMSCEDPQCPGESNYVGTRLAGKYSVCRDCEQAVAYVKYPARELHTQLTFFRKLVDVGSHAKKNLVDPTLDVAFNTLKDCVDNFLQYSDFNVINIENMFSLFTVKKDKNKDNQENDNKANYDHEMYDLIEDEEEI